MEESAVLAKFLFYKASASPLWALPLPYLAGAGGCFSRKQTTEREAYH